MRWPKRARTGLLILLSLAPLMAEPEPSSTAFKEVAEALVCQCGCNLVLSTCAMDSCHSAIPMRKEIVEKLGAGAGKEAIVAGFVERYGLKILSAPPARGFHLSAWIMPFFALVVGAFIVQQVLHSWRRKRAQEPASTAQAAITEEQRAQIERDLQDFET